MRNDSKHVPMVTLNIIVLNAFFFAVVFAQTVASHAPIELTNSNLADYLTRLRTDSSPADYVIKEPLRLTGPQDQWKVKNLKFERNGVIFLGATSLTVVVEGNIFSEGKQLVIFSSFSSGESDARAGDNGAPGSNGTNSGQAASPGTSGGRGQDGTPGLPGMDSGDLTLRLRFVPKPGFTVALIGQNGGHGGNGGAGGQGGTGQKGRPGESSVFGCNRGGDNGGGGGAGGDGGNGGPGGSCGAGGRLTIIAPQAILNQIQDSIIVDTTPSFPGFSGNPGAAGTGARGGDGGDGGGFCGGGSPGPAGAQGKPGVSPNVTRSACRKPSLTLIPIS
jgi:hypothetical protein